MHHIDTYVMHQEKAIWELHKNAMCCFEQILEVTPNKTDVQPLMSHLTSIQDEDMRETAEEVSMYS